MRLTLALGLTDSREGVGFAPPPANDAEVQPSCRDIMAERLGRIDATLAAWAGDARPSSLTARRILIADRNAQAAACRACGACTLAAIPFTDPLPLL